MTGYGQAAHEGQDFSAAVWVRSLNHRYFDLTVHASRRLAGLEPALKELVGRRVHRGRLELGLRAQDRRGGGRALSADAALVAGLVSGLRALQAEHGLAGAVSVSDVARFPGVFETEDDGAPALDDDLRATALGVAAQALDGLDGMRGTEGARLQAELLRLLAAIEGSVVELARLADAGRAERSAAWAQRARELASEAGLDEGRLYQELARLLDRGDVNEELQRLTAHAAQAREAIAGAGPHGKRLDFLAQELMREANTLGSKAVTAALVREVVALKTQIERFREQVQNVE